MLLFRGALNFEWDEGNHNKNFLGHEVTDQECEEIFFGPHKFLLKDVVHSDRESRYILMGETKQGRRLFVVFTTRKFNVRIISARDLNKRERQLYEEAIKNENV